MTFKFTELAIDFNELIKGTLSFTNFLNKHKETSLSVIDLAQNWVCNKEEGKLILEEIKNKENSKTRLNKLINQPQKRRA